MPQLHIRTFSANENDPEGPSLFIYYAVLYRHDMQISPSMPETNIQRAVPAS